MAKFFRRKSEPKETVMNILEFARNIIMQFPKIDNIANAVHIDFTDDNKENYGLSSTGDTLVSEDILGSQTRRHNFVLYANYQSINDYDRLNNSGVLLELQYFLERQAKEQIINCNINGIGESKKGKITDISCGNGMIYTIPNENNIDLIRYQLQIYITYNLLEN